MFNFIYIILLKPYYSMLKINNFMSLEKDFIIFPLKINN